MHMQELKPGRLLKILCPAYYSKVGGLANDLLAFVTTEATANVRPGTTIKLVKQDSCPLWGSEQDGWWRLEFPNGDQVLEHDKTLSHPDFFKVLLD